MLIGRHSLTHSDPSDLNLIKNKIPVLGLEIVERQSNFLICATSTRDEQWRRSYLHDWTFSLKKILN